MNTLTVVLLSVCVVAFAVIGVTAFIRGFIEGLKKP